MINNVTLIPLTRAGVPSGNYDGSSQEWYSDPVKAANYYKGHGWIQTIWYNVTDFQGEIVIQATLDPSPGAVTDPDFATSPGWFTVDTFGDLSSQTTDYRPVTVAGNFTWLRAKIIGFDSGTINRVHVTY